MKSSDSENIVKHFKIGCEVELFTIDTQGNMIHEAQTVIDAVKENYPKIAITSECGKNMLELGVPPHIDARNVMGSLVDALETVTKVAADKGIILYPYSTYPGTFNPEFNDAPSYQMKEQIFGAKRWKIAAECIGHHCHFTLPWGVFNEQEKSLKHLVRSKHKQSLVNIYNMYIAMDPVLTVLTQSSPFYRGQHLGKDSRAIAYRGGRAMAYRDGLYSKYPKFGALQQYKHTGTDLIHTINNKNRHWLNMVKKYSPEHFEELKQRASILGTSWNPVKVNPHGTIEQRGMDMNMPSILLAVDLIIQYISKMIQEEFVQVLPSDVGLEDPFRREKNVIFIPPYSHVRLHLQNKSAYEGLANDSVFAYAKSLYKLAKKSMPKDVLPFLSPIDTMLKERKTASDHLLQKAKKGGWKQTEDLTNGQCSQLALDIAQQFTKDIQETKKLLEPFSRNGNGNGNGN